MSDNWHVYPTGDLIEHETSGDGCVCIPAAKLHDGAWVLVHHSLDGRELHEQGNPAPADPHQ